MKAEQKLLKLFEDLEEAGASLTLTFSTRESKTTAKLAHRMPYFSVLGILMIV